MKVRKKTEKTKPHYYVDNRILSKELAIWAHRQRDRKKTGDPQERVPELIGEAILKICTGLGYKSNFINYPYKEEMIGNAIETNIRYCKNFGREGRPTNNAFAYISQIAHFAFIRKITKEKKRWHSHLKYLFNEMDVDMLASQLGDDKSHYQTYLDDMRKTLDDMGVDITETPRISQPSQVHLTYDEISKNKDGASITDFMED